MTAYRSPTYRAGSKGAPCSLRIVGVCRDERDTVVPCHVRDQHTGRSIKASDLSVLDGCHRCHEVFDRRATMSSGALISDEEWTFYALRGLQETLERRHDMGLLRLPGDDRKPRERPVKPRMPAGERRSMPKGPPLKSANRLPGRGQVKFPKEEER